MTEAVNQSQTELEKKGLAIKLFRQRKNWSQGKLSEESGVSRVSISKIESAKSFANTKTVLKLCKALGIQESELIQESLKPSNPYEERMAALLTEILFLTKTREG